MSSPTINHWTTLEQSLYYLKETPRRGLFYGNHVPILDVLKMQIEQDLKLIEDPLHDIVSLLKEIWCLKK